MEHDKDSLERAERAWDMKARSEGYKCEVCSAPISYDDREVYFRTKMCGYCAHVSEKND